jgi:hypothetical protein
MARGKKHSPKRAVEMTEYGKHGKPRSRLSTLPTLLGNPYGIPTFPLPRRGDQYLKGPRKGLVTDVSGPQRNACPGTLNCRLALRDTSLLFMYLQLELLGQFNTKERSHSILIASAAAQQYVWIEAVVLAILWLAICESRESAESTPISRAGVSLISAGECLRDEC